MGFGAFSSSHKKYKHNILVHANNRINEIKRKIEKRGTSDKNDSKAAIVVKLTSNTVKVVCQKCKVFGPQMEAVGPEEQQRRISTQAASRYAKPPPPLPLEAHHHIVAPVHRAPHPPSTDPVFLSRAPVHRAPPPPLADPVYLARAPVHRAPPPPSADSVPLSPAPLPPRAPAPLPARTASFSTARSAPIPLPPRQPIRTESESLPLPIRGSPAVRLHSRPPPPVPHSASSASSPLSRRPPPPIPVTTQPEPLSTDVPTISTADVTVITPTVTVHQPQVSQTSPSSTREIIRIDTERKTPRRLNEYIDAPKHFDKAASPPRGATRLPDIRSDSPAVQITGTTPIPNRTSDASDNSSGPIFTQPQKDKDPPSAATSAVHRTPNGTDSIVCSRCGKCKCAECRAPRDCCRPLWLCDKQCECSLPKMVEYASCLCCVRAGFYHCPCFQDSKGSEEAGLSDEPCACFEQPDCCKRWTCLGLTSLVLPCLCFYWPLQCCLSTGTACYNRCTRRGCHCRKDRPAACKRLLIESESSSGNT